MATSLVFDKALATGQPVHLVFGDDGGGGAGATLPASVAATLPGLGARITTGRRAPMVVAGALPGPGVAVHLVRAWPAAVAAGLPGMGVHVQTRLVRPASLRVGLPAPGVHVSLVPAPSGKLVATLPGLGGALGLGRKRPATGGVRIPGIQVAVELGYIINTREPVIGGARGRVQDATRLGVPLSARLQRGAPLPAAMRGASTWADPMAAATRGRYQDAAALAQATTARLQVAQRTPGAALHASMQDAVRLRGSTTSRHQDGSPVQAGTRLRYQDADRTRRPWLRSGMQQGVQVVIAAASALQQGQFLPARLRVVEQDGMRPPPGRWPGRPIPPAWDPCYLPPNGLHVDLLFQEEWSGATGLIFVCERHGGPGPSAAITIPIRRYYVVANDIVLRRVDGDIALLAYAFTLSIDADSWTWSWSATLRRDAQPYLEPDSEGPVELEAVINGVPYRLMVERIGRDAQFGSVRIRASGRGLASVLATPHAPTLNFGNATPRTGQQLMADVLTINGVSIGWDVDWGLVDWSVPAGAWAMQGNYIDAITDIAGAVGGYVQPHATARTLRILPRYPSVPWEWDVVAPHVELPAAAASVESVEWIDMPAYNAVYVGGISKGVHGPFKRTGTAGDMLAPAVNHALITHANAHRQRGIAEISNTGRQAHYEIKTQVHPSTGLILPGQFVRYVGDTTVTGIVRSTRLDWSRPVMRQTIGVETHVIA